MFVVFCSLFFAFGPDAHRDSRTMHNVVAIDATVRVCNGMVEGDTEWICACDRFVVLPRNGAAALPLVMRPKKTENRCLRGGGSGIIFALARGSETCRTIDR